MDDNRHQTIGKAYEIDRTAVNIFEKWLLPNKWLPREQKPDVFVDYVVEIVRDGEPTGSHFAAQIKGYEDNTKNPKPLKYPFETKHLKYYLNQCQHPVALFLINITTGEGYWFFVQKFLKQNIAQKTLDEQDSLTIHFVPEDNLFNTAKFKYMLSEAEQFARDLHPGSVHAAIIKRKTELESIDPRCSVSISIKDGKEHLQITAKEEFSFQTRVKTQNIEGWRKFFESGAEVKIEPGELEIIGAPLLEEAFKKLGANSKIQFGVSHPASIQIQHGKGETVKFLQINGKASAGMKFASFKAELPESPFSITGEIPFDDQFIDQCSVNFHFAFDKWVGQQILLLAHFDQIDSLISASCIPSCPKMELSIHGNVIWSGELRDMAAKKISNILFILDWLKKCRWLAQHYNVNPALPQMNKITDDQWDTIEELYGLLKDKEICVPEPGKQLTFEASKAPEEAEFLPAGTLTIGRDAQILDFLGNAVTLGPTRHSFSAVRLTSRTVLENGGARFVFDTSEDTKRTSTLL